MLENAIGTSNLVDFEMPEDGRLGQLELLEEVGRGSMGIVFRARQIEMDRIVAVKVIPVAESDAKKLSARIKLERTAMARLDHANVVPIYSFGHINDSAYLVMKWVDGISLDQLLGENASLEQAKIQSQMQSEMRIIARIGADAASGLEHAHKQGLIHRDIKPANLLLDVSGKTWITDFGLAKIYDFAASLTGTGEVVGTPRYMAPEQMRGIADERSDIYSLGVTLYELATGVKAWDKASGVDKLPPVQEINPSVPEDFAQIIDKCCEPNPINRFQSATELRVVLFRFIDGLKPVDRRRQAKRPDNERYKEICRRNSKLAWIIGGISVPVICLVLLGYWPFSLAESGPMPVNVEQTQTKKAYQKLVEEFGEGDGEDFVGVIGEFVKGSVADMSEQYQLKEETTNQIESKIDQVIDKIEKEGIDEQRLDVIVDGYRSSSLPTATKILELTYPLGRSGLSSREKKAAFYTLQMFARLVVNKKIARDEAERVLAGLFQGRVPKVDSIRSATLSDQLLRSWLNFVNSSLEPMLAEVQNEDTSINSELEAIIDSYLHGNGG
ncbi:MAG: serine/threonine-protein kinase [Pirellulaceae bacterium]